MKSPGIPEKAGIVKKLRAEGVKIPIVALTANAMKGDEKNA